jgi:GT2 family glycosyltransferase
VPPFEVSTEEAPEHSGALPALSVVMAVFNGERFLRRALDSLLTQDFSNFELLVVDDGSTDTTPDILGEYASRDHRMTVQCQPNRGTSAALNSGFALARAPLVARLDSDDVAMAHRLERQSRFLRENEAVGMVGGQVVVIDDEDREIAPARYPLSDREIRRTFAETSPFVHSAVMLRKAVFDQVGGYRQAFDGAEDLDLWLRIAERSQVANIPEFVAMYRIHENQVSAERLEAQAVRSLAARRAAAARTAGDPDPFVGAERIDEKALLAQGCSPQEISAAIVHAATWMARTMDRAGYGEAAQALFETASKRARSSSSRAPLLASVQRARATRHAEMGHPLRSKLREVQAALIERGQRRRD